MSGRPGPLPDAVPACRVQFRSGLQKDSKGGSRWTGGHQDTDRGCTAGHRYGDVNTLYIGNFSIVKFSLFTMKRD